MERNFNKIVIVSLCDGFSRDIGNLLSQNLGMMYCDTQALIEYELIDKKLIEELSTKKYLQEAEKKVIKHISSFENVVVAISFDYLTHNLNIIEPNSLIVFVDLPKTYLKDKVGQMEMVAYESRTEKLNKIATVKLKIRKYEPNFVCQKIIEALGGIL